MKTESLHHVEPKILPPPNHNVIVCCRGFRCLGFIDSDGKWRDTYSFAELPEVIGWSYLGDVKTLSAA